MKKYLFAAALASLSFQLFAFDPNSVLKTSGKVQSYTKTDYTITEKFGDYYRTPKAKYVHNFDAEGRVVESLEYTNKDVLVDRIVYTYDANGNLTATTGYDADNKLSWKTVSTYDDKNVKTEESEFNSSDILVSRSIWKNVAGKQSDESYYNADGALLGKIITKFDDLNRETEVCNYAAAGTLDVKKVYTYNEAGRLSETAYINSDGIITSRVVIRFDEKYNVTEEQSYNKENKLFKRKIFKYDDKGNVTRTTTYSVSEKFGGTATELIDINEYSYVYAGDALNALSAADAK